MLIRSGLPVAADLPSAQAKRQFSKVAGRAAHEAGVIAELLTPELIERASRQDGMLARQQEIDNLIRQVRFVDAFPSALGAIDFHTQNTDVEYVTGDATFTYSNFEFIK